MKPLPINEFNLVYSSLAFHYIVNLTKLFSTIYQFLNPNGHFIFSIEHPLYTVPLPPGWVLNAEGEKHGALISINMKAND